MSFKRWLGWAILVAGLLLSSPLLAKPLIVVLPFEGAPEARQTVIRLLRERYEVAARLRLSTNRPGLNAAAQTEVGQKLGDAQATIQAQAIAQRVQLTKLWTARHGGVQVVLQVVLFRFVLGQISVVDIGQIVLRQEAHGRLRAVDQSLDIDHSVLHIGLGDLEAHEVNLGVAAFAAFDLSVDLLDP